MKRLSPILSEFLLFVLIAIGIYAGAVWASTESEETKHIGAQE